MWVEMRKVPGGSSWPRQSSAAHLPQSECLVHPVLLAGRAVGGGGWDVPTSSGQEERKTPNSSS